MFDKLSSLLKTNQINPSEEEIAMFRLHTNHTSFRNGELLAKKGMKNKRIFFINQGTVRTVTFENDQEVTLDFFTEGEFVSANTTAALGETASFSIEALSNTNVLYWEMEDIRLFKDTIKASEQIEVFALSEVIKKQEQRNLSLLSKSAEERYLELLATKPFLINLVAVKIVASYLGITSESMSRIRKKIRN